MRIQQNKLEVAGNNIKAMKGDYGSGLLQLDSQRMILLIGSMEFPLVQMNKISFKPNGSLIEVENKLAIVYGNFMYTPNVISLTVEPNLTTGQAAAFSVQYGQMTVVLNNLTPQVIHLIHVPGTSMSVTATNYATGAVNTESVIPTAGQYYKFSSVSETTTTGELSQVCIREEVDYEKTPHFEVKGDKSLGAQFLKSSGFEYGNESIAETYLIDNWSKLVASMQRGISIVENYMVEALQGVYTLKKADDLNFSYTVIPNVPMYLDPGRYKLYLRKSPTPDNFSTWQGSYTSYAASRSNMTEEEEVTNVWFEVATKETPYLWSITPIPSSTVTGITYKHSLSNQWAWSITGDVFLKHAISLYGPLEYKCSAWRPVDTRQTTHSIKLTISELN